MKNYLAILLCLLSVFGSLHGAIAFQGAAGTLNGLASNSYTFSYTVNGSSNFLLYGARIDSGTVTATATWNGVSMTDTGSVLRPSARSYIFRQENPATGTHNIVISLSGTATVTSCAADYSGVSATGQPDSTNTQSNSGASVTASTTVVASGSWLFAVPSGYNNNEEWSAGSGTTRRASDTTYGTTGCFDSNGAPGTGSQSLVMTHSADPFTLGSAAVIMSFKPDAGGTALKDVIGRGVIPVAR